MRLRDVCLFVGRTYLYEIKPSCFPKFLEQFSSSHWSIFSPKIGINKLKLVNLTNTKGYLFVVLICIFLITDGIEHIFIRLLAIRNFSWVKCLIRSLPIFYWVVFFLLIYGSSVYILDNYPVTVMCIKNIFFSLFVIFLKPKRPLNSNSFLLSIVLPVHQDAMRQRDRIWLKWAACLPGEGTGSSQGHSPLYPWTMRETEKALKMNPLVSKLSIMETQIPYIEGSTEVHTPDNACWNYWAKCCTGPPPGPSQLYDLGSHRAPHSEEP